MVSDGAIICIDCAIRAGLARRERECEDCHGTGQVVEEIETAIGTAEDIRAFRAGKGCPCCHWGATAPKERPERAEGAALLAELMPEDLDGQAAVSEDLLR